MANSSILQSCAVVLVRTKFAGNLGSVARAMANFGVMELRLVAPEASPDTGEARALASHGGYLLDRASQHATLQEAVADCIWVGATSARTGGLFRKQNVLELKSALSHARSLATLGRVALVFGPEDHGLSNEEISLCHHLLHIHASADYPVLNLAQAVCVCLYEWFQSTVPLHHASEDPPVVFDELNRSLNHLEEALRAIHFIWGEKGDSVAHALRHLLARARPNALENKLLHGLARQILWYVEKHPRKE